MIKKFIDYLSKGNKVIEKFLGKDFMEDRMKGVLFGIFGLFLWFSPWVNVGGYVGMSVHQSGQHIGGIAYLLLFASFMYAAICCLFTTQARSSIAWGLIFYLLLSIASAFFAFRKCKEVPQATHPASRE